MSVFKFGARVDVLFFGGNFYGKRSSSSVTTSVIYNAMVTFGGFLCLFFYSQYPQVYCKSEHVGYVVQGHCHRNFTLFTILGNVFRGILCHFTIPIRVTRPRRLYFRTTGTSFCTFRFHGGFRVVSYLRGRPISKGQLFFRYGRSHVRPKRFWRDCSRPIRKVGLPKSFTRGAPTNFQQRLLVFVRIVRRGKY